MRKLILTIAAMAITATATIAQEQTYRCPSWNCRDLAVLREALSLAPYSFDKNRIAFLIDFAQNGEPTTFAQLSERIDNVIDAIDPDFTLDRRITLKKQYAFCSNQFFTELVAFCKLNPNKYDFYVALRDETEWGFDIVSNYSLRHLYEPEYVIRAVEYLNQRAIALAKPDGGMLDLLKKMNRLYSARLMDDKEAWSGVVAQIRTLIEAYK